MSSDTHIVINTILIIAAIGIITILLIILYKFWQLLKPQQTLNKLHDKYSVKEDSIYSLVVQKIICQLKQELSAVKIVIGRYHNGGNYVNGLPMKKFTITHETAGGTDIPIMDKGIAILNSRYSEAFAQVATLGEYCVSDMQDCTDQNFKRDMQAFGFKATYLFLIRQFDGKEDGYISVNFKYTTVLTAEQRHRVAEQIPRIMGLLNMDEQHLKDEKGV